MKLIGAFLLLLSALALRQALPHSRLKTYGFGHGHKIRTLHGHRSNSRIEKIEQADTAFAVPFPWPAAFKARLQILQGAGNQAQHICGEKHG